MCIRGFSHCFGLIVAFMTSEQIQFQSGFLCSDMVVRLKGAIPKQWSVMLILWRLKCSSFEEIKDVTHTFRYMLDAQWPSPRVARITEYKSQQQRGRKAPPFSWSLPNFHLQTWAKSVRMMDGRGGLNQTALISPFRHNVPPIFFFSSCPPSLVSHHLRAGASILFRLQEDFQTPRLCPATL